MKNLIFLILFSTQIVFAQNENVPVYSVETSECLANKGVLSPMTILEDFTENDSNQIIIFVTTANCGGIHEFKIFQSKDTLYLNWKEGGITETEFDSLCVTENGFMPFKNTDTSIIKGELIVFEITSYDITECDCCFQFKIYFALLPVKKEYIIKIKDQYFQGETRKKRKKRSK